MLETYPPHSEYTHRRATRSLCSTVSARKNFTGLHGLFWPKRVISVRCHLPASSNGHLMHTYRDSAPGAWWRLRSRPTMSQFGACPAFLSLMVTLNTYDCLSQRQMCSGELYRVRMITVVARGDDVAGCAWILSVSSSWWRQEFQSDGHDRYHLFP